MPEVTNRKQKLKKHCCFNDISLLKVDSKIIFFKTFAIILPSYNSISCTDQPLPMSSLLFSTTFLQGSVARVAAQDILTSNF